MNNKDNKKQLHIRKIVPLLGQLIRDIKPRPERLKLNVRVVLIPKQDILRYCTKYQDQRVYRKMAQHELRDEPVEKIVTIYHPKRKKIKKKHFNRILSDLGYNVNVIFSKNHGCDYEAAINVNGYVIPGWHLLIKLLRKLNSNLAVFWGKRFAPGRSRLHIRIFEGKYVWYVIAHIDEFNWINVNVSKVKKSHAGSGQGDYKNGTKLFVQSLEYYFKE